MKRNSEPVDCQEQIDQARQSEMAARNQVHDKEYSNGRDKEKLRELYLAQKETLDIFLKKGAISQGQYEKSLGDLTRKMGMDCKDSELPEN